MCHFLVACVRVVVHLLSLGYFLAVRTHCAFGFILVDLADGLAIRAHHCLAAVGLHLKLRAASLGHAEALHHVVSHLAHHLVHAPEHAFSRKKWIIFEGVAHAEALKHTTCHLIHFLVTPVHHLKQVAAVRLHGGLVLGC